MNCEGCVILPQGFRGARRPAPPTVGALGMMYRQFHQQPRDGLYRPTPTALGQAALWPLWGEKPWYLDARVWGAGAVGAVLGFIIAKVL